MRSKSRVATSVPRHRLALLAERNKAKLEHCFDERWRAKRLKRLRFMSSAVLRSLLLRAGVLK